MKDHVCVVIPTLNEAQTIAQVIASVRPFCAEILVIDGNSSDGTAGIARAAGARVETFAARGKGLALIHALQIVTHPITVFIDADGSHEGADIPALVKPILDGDADMTIGDRWSGGSDELHGDLNKWLRRSGSRLLTTIVNVRFGGKLIDIQNGFRALRTEVGRDIGLDSPDFTIEQEMAMKFLAGRFRVVNVPSHEYARQGGEAKLNLRRVWFRFGVVVLRHVFGLSRPRLNCAQSARRKF
jgi:dolichol-phosphate mannosyltransferase